MDAATTPGELGFIALVLRKRLWESRHNNSDGIIVVQGYHLLVHTSIIGAESSHLEQVLRESFHGVGKHLLRAGLGRTFCLESVGANLPRKLFGSSLFQSNMPR